MTRQIYSNYFSDDFSEISATISERKSYRMVYSEVFGGKRYELHLGSVRWILENVLYCGIQIVAQVLFSFARNLLTILYIQPVNRTLQAWKSKVHLGLTLLSNKDSISPDGSRTSRGLERYCNLEIKCIKAYQIRLRGINLPLGVFIIIEGGLKG